MHYRRQIPKEKYTIYRLVCPVSGDTKYIGRTRRSLNERLSGHLSDARRGEIQNRALLAWLRYLLSKGIKPEIEPLGWAYGLEQAKTTETRFIRDYSDDPLLNLQHHRSTDGRKGSRPFTERYMKAVG